MRILLTGRSGQVGSALLDNSKIGALFGITLPDWRHGLAAMLSEIH